MSTSNPERWGCWGRTAMPSYPVQDGWTEDERRKMVELPDVFFNGALPCVYSVERPWDAKCEGCPIHSKNYGGNNG